MGEAYCRGGDVRRVGGRGQQNQRTEGEEKGGFSHINTTRTEGFPSTHTETAEETRC